MSGRFFPVIYGLIVERRARKLRDPIERLRYLRRATAPKPHSGRRWLVAAAVLLAVATLRSDATYRASLPRTIPTANPGNRGPEVPNVWPVEQNGEYDLYSNGLRIENRLAVSNEPRSYFLIASGSGSRGPRRSQPAGIVFHITESDQAPFEWEQKAELKRIGRELLLYVRNKRAYHFVIDRFGRVHRIVVESDTANHAGHSVWADSRWSYLDLNDSFLGVAFEARKQPDQPAITEAQLRAGTELTEMLRAKYNLAPEDCIVHAQVSVNPSNWRIGWHTDWGADFPFRELGLPDNYQVPNPSVYLFGFEPDDAYRNATGPGMWKGLASADERLRQDAAAQGVTPGQYRRLLQRRYRDAISALEHKNIGEENQHESN